MTREARARTSRSRVPQRLGRLTRRCSRPPSAREIVRVFMSLCAARLGRSWTPNRWAGLSRTVVSFLSRARWRSGLRALSCSAKRNRTWYQSPWCGVWFRARLSQPESRRRPVVLRVLPIGVIPPRAGARIVAAHVSHAAPRRRLGAPAQPAHAVDAATRPQDRCFFET